MLFINKICLNQTKPNQILNNVIITKTKVLFTKAYVSLADFDYQLFRLSYFVRSDLLVEETGVSGENHRPVASH
jgi:hypothetical protein